MDQGVRRCLGTLDATVFFVFPVYLAETALVCFVCLFAFPGIAVTHKCLRGICLWHGPWHQTSACPALPRSPRLGVVTGTFWRACLPSQVSWLMWKSRMCASLSFTPFPSAPVWTETHQPLQRGTLHGSQGHCVFLQVRISLVTQWPSSREGSREVIPGQWLAQKIPSPLKRYTRMHTYAHVHVRTRTHTHPCALYVYRQNLLDQSLKFRPARRELEGVRGHGHVARGNPLEEKARLWPFL